jgi:uncharacterized SAM-binding protein YcdF (DUF218 family)
MDKKMVVGMVGGILLSLLGAWTLGALWLDRTGGPPKAGARFDAIVVAGCRVGPDGQPSPALARRVKQAVGLAKSGVAPMVIFTGGTGGYPPAESVAAARLAASLGLPESAMILEDRSTSTEENARFARLAANEAGIPAERVLVVTDRYHTFRAQRVFQRYFPEVSATGTTPRINVRIHGAFREVLAIAGYAVMGRL